MTRVLRRRVLRRRSGVDRQRECAKAQTGYEDQRSPRRSRSSSSSVAAEALDLSRFTLCAHSTPNVKAPWSSRSCGCGSAALRGDSTEFLRPAYGDAEVAVRMTTSAV
jgi:hypothetical protein